MGSLIQDQLSQLPIEVLKDVIDTYVTEKQPSDADIEACEALRKSIDPHSSVPLDYDKFEKLLSSGTFFFGGRLRKKLAPHLISRSAYKTTQRALSAQTTLVRCKSSATIAILPDTISSIAKNAFSDCPNLAHIICTETQWMFLPPSLKHRIQGVTIIGDDMKIIPDAFFSRNQSLVYIGIPDTVTTIGEYAFAGCINLCYPMLPNTITEIHQYAFFHCAFSEFVFPPAVTIITAGVLKNCGNLTNIELPPLATTIHYQSLVGTAISNLFIPRTLIHFGRGVFSYPNQCITIIRCETPAPLLHAIANHRVTLTFSPCAMVVDNDYNPVYIRKPCDWIKPDGFEKLPSYRKALSYIPFLTHDTWLRNQLVASVAPKGVTVLDCVDGLSTFLSNLSPTDRQTVNVLMLCAYRLKDRDNALPSELWIVIATIALNDYFPVVKSVIERDTENKFLSFSVSPIYTIYNLFRDGPDEPTAPHDPDESKAPRQSA
ncbi:MAG: hypothetical protein COB66_03165 [Coxiella sp. (in: Bacteria)]|nr:MAG: hypothetical protein COB66_03165 [Coxiella sp. (in: g-proteobacteria)]